MSSIAVPYIDLTSQYRAERQDILDAVDRVFSRGDYILGKEVEEFEKRFAELSHVSFAIGVANATDGLMLALKALGIGHGDEVITVPNSFIASASAIALCGAKPVFVDVTVDMNMDPTLLEDSITSRTKAIIPVHLTGRCARMDEIMAVAKRRGIPVVEDAAQSVGSRLNERVSGSMGVVGSFSLHPLKNLNAMGDSGVLTTSDPVIFEKLKLLRNHGLKNRDVVVDWGHNSRLDTVQAAILNHRLTQLPKVIERRREIADRYRSQLPKSVVCPVELPGEFHTYHVFVIQVSRRDELQKYLYASGIETKIHYPIPIHLQPCASYLGYRNGDFPVCEELAGKILSLPVNQYLTDQQVDQVCEAITKFYV